MYSINSPEQSKVYTSRDVQLNAETSSNTHGVTVPDKLSQADSSVGNNNISADDNHADCGEKENNKHDSVDSVEKKTANKKRKHQKHKLPCSDDSHKHNKKFMLKEKSGTNNISNGKENNTNNNISTGDFSGAVDKFSSPDQLHIIDKRKVIKKSKLTDNKGRQTHEHQTVMQNCLNKDLLVQDTKTEDIRCSKVQNDNIEELSVTMKTPPCGRKLEKARKIKQKAAVNELGSYKEETEMPDSTDKRTVKIHNESSVIKTSGNNSDDVKEIACDSNMKNTEQASAPCMESEKENGDYHKEYTNIESEIIVGTTTSLKDRANTLQSKKTHISDTSESAGELFASSKTCMKEIAGPIDLGQRKRGRKPKNIVEKKASFNINILKPTNRVGFTDSDELCATDSLHQGDRKPAVTDHQVVPDMRTELLTDCKSSPDMAFSSMIHKSEKREITDDIVVKALPDNLCEDEKYLSFDSLKLESNFPQKVDEESLDENSDDMMLDLDESTGVALGETNKGSSSCDNSRGDPFYEFDCAGEVDLIEE